MSESKTANDEITITNVDQRPKQPVKVSLDGHNLDSFDDLDNVSEKVLNDIVQKIHKRLTSEPTKLLDIDMRIDMHIRAMCENILLKREIDQLKYRLDNVEERLYKLESNTD